MENELYHYGVKGMKWGVRKKRTRVSREKIKASIDKGAAVTKQFLKDNGPMLAKSTAILAFSAVGLPLAGAVISNYSGLDLSAFGVSSHTEVYETQIKMGPIKTPKFDPNDYL